MGPPARSGDDERGGTFYDDTEALRAYLAHRHNPVRSPNLVMEEPAFLAEAGDLAGLRILDLGCGDGTFARQCLAGGCQSYVGVDGSAAMLAEALVSASASADELRVRFVRADLEDFRAEPGSVDLVTARLVLHYVDGPDLDLVLAEAHRALGPAGRLILSVVHPVISSGNHPPDGPRTTQVVDNYFQPGPRRREWFGRPVVWYHRSIEQYITALGRAGFTLSALQECEPVEELFGDQRGEYERRRRVPLFLLLSAECR